MGHEFNGLRVIESVYLVEDGEPYQVRRTWLERLFSLPWRPLVTSRTVVPRVPMKGMVRLNATTVVIHPETWRLLKAALPPTTYGSFPSSPCGSWIGH